METSDFAVIGLGSVGAFAAKTLAQQGHKVVGFEAAGIANDKSAVGGDTRLFRRLYAEGTQFHDFIERAYEIWRETTERVPDAFLEHGGLFIANDVAKESLLAYAERFDTPFAAVDEADIRKRYPQFNLDGGDYAGFADPSAGILRTDVVVLDAVEQAEAAGCEIVHALALSVRSSHHGVVITTDRGSWEVGRVIVATGARTTTLLPQLAGVAEPYRIMMTWFQARDEGAFSPENFPIFTWDTPGAALYGAPAIDGRHVKVSGFIPPRPIQLDGYDYENLVPREELLACESQVMELFPGLHPAPIRSGAYVDLYTRDSDFILDWVDEEQQVFVASGFSGRGFKMCSALGEHAAKVVLGDAERIERFSLARFAD